MIRGSWCSKSSLAKAAGAEVAVLADRCRMEVAVLADRWRMARRCGAKHICKSKMHKTPYCRSHFWSSDVEKWHAVVARITFASQNAQNTTISDPFWKFPCSKMARGCGAKHMFKSKCTNHHIRGAILEVPMFKNGTPLWREAYL